MDRYQELTYLCGCKEGRFMSRANYEPAAAPDTVCDKCRRPGDFGFQQWSWTAVAPKRGGPGAGREYDEMMMFLSGLVPQLDQMAIADMETVVNRTATQLRIDGFQLFNKFGQIDADTVGDRAKREIVQFVRSQMKQIHQQQQQQEKQQQKREKQEKQQQASAVGVDARRSKNRHAPPRPVDRKQPKTNVFPVGADGFF
ncbi:hypothetical protein PG991_013800 [Apiospora marii]|uniref:Uncharacterized protein n=1 Tax=Apiospora marii TaxID=335849 RepID=A0ABR1R7D7_9PEZI